MKNKQQIQERISELYARMKELSSQQPDAVFSQEQIMAAIYRLQGNIGALEWAVRP